jgi:ribonuclease HII
VGSGYTSDPVTQKWLEEWMRTHTRLPECARHSWVTADILLEKKEQSLLSTFIGKIKGVGAKEGLP